MVTDRHVRTALKRVGMNDRADRRPTGTPDPVTGNPIMKLFAQLNGEETALIVITHDPEVSRRCPGRTHIGNGSIDPEGRFNPGSISQRPHGTRDHRLTFRAISGEYTDADGSRRFAAMGAGGEPIHGSSALDPGTGYGRFASNGPDAGRWYVPAGTRTGTGMPSLSLEGQYGRIGDGEEVLSAAPGIRYDVARGLSAKPGVNHASTEATIGGVRIADTEETNTVVLMRYSFRGGPVAIAPGITNFCRKVSGPAGRPPPGAPGRGTTRSSRPAPSGPAALPLPQPGPDVPRPPWVSPVCS